MNDDGVTEWIGQQIDGLLPSWNGKYLQLIQNCLGAFLLLHKKRRRNGHFYL